MKLNAPEPAIDLYEHGFQSDLLDRAKIGKQLSSLIERVEDPMVIAIDGEWGSGKSFFLRSWVGAHEKENGGSALTVFFDAYRHDFLDDPLIGLTSAIGDRLPRGSKQVKLWAGAKAAAAKLWRPAARIGLAVTTAGASEIAGAVVDAGLAAGEKELSDAVDRFWRREDAKREAMTQFRNVLLSVSQGEEGREPQRLAVVVDELDRCRPDYALSVLETIKHFFDVEGVHFILGVNLKELSNSVKVRYGAGSDAASYLEKFLSIIVRLPDQVGEERKSASSRVYFNRMAREMGIEPRFVEQVDFYLAKLVDVRSVSLRSVRKLLSQMVITAVPDEGFAKFLSGYQVLIGGLVIIKALSPDLYAKCTSGKISMKEVQDYFGVNENIGEEDDHGNKVINRVWATFLAGDQLPKEEGWRDLFGMFGVDQPQRTFSNAIRNHLESFRLV